MEIYYTIVMFVFGTIFGSFYNVVGDRLPDNKSIVYPPSHCPKCHHRLTPIELIPIISYLIQGGKCKNCKCKIPVIHPIYECFVGLMFMLSYIVFGFSYEFVISLTFISMLCILIVSDINYMIIPDEVLFFFLIALAIEKFIFYGYQDVLWSLLSAFIAFIVMLSIKLFGDFIFKKESMGGGDIKLLFVFGFVLGWQMSLLSIFVGSVIGLPISLLILKIKKTNVIPFGPFLSLGAIILFLLNIDFDTIINTLLK